jgi:hemerythrin-like domain-containing protein
MPKTSRSRKDASVDAIEILTEDHKKVQKIFKEFEKNKEDAGEEEKAEMVRTVCQELTIHAQIEEEIFYPALRKVIEEDLLDEAEVEHGSAKQMIAELEKMEPGDDLYDAKFTVLGEYVNHHIKEEQKEIFPQAKKAKLDLEQLGKKLMRRKQALQREMGIAISEEEVEEA